MLPRYSYLELDCPNGALAARERARRALEAAGGRARGAVAVDVLRAAPVLLRAASAHVPLLRASLALQPCDAAPAPAPARTAPSLLALLAAGVGMSRSLVCGPGGKDVVLLAPTQTLSSASRVSLPPPPPAPGLLHPDGTINWACPCLGGMATGPCGPQFREAFTCFHHSEAYPKGSECYDKFSVMQDCMKQYPDLYGRDDDDVTLPAAAAAAPAPPADNKQ